MLPRVASVSGSRIDDRVGVRQQRGQLVDSVQPVARAADDTGHRDPERGEPALDRAPDRAVADDQDARAVQLARRAVLPAPHVRGAELAVGGAEQRAHHPFRDRDVAGAARGAQRRARRDVRLEPVRPGRQALHDLHGARRGQCLEVVAAHRDHERGVARPVRERAHLDAGRRRGADPVERLGGDGGDHPATVPGRRRAGHAGVVRFAS